MKYNYKYAMEMLKNIAESKEDKPYLEVYLKIHEGAKHVKYYEFHNTDRWNFRISGKDSAITPYEMLHVKELHKAGLIDHSGQWIYATPNGKDEVNLYYSLFKWKWGVREAARFIEKHWLFILLALLFVQTTSSAISAMNSFSY